MAAKNTLQFFLGPLLKKFFQDMGRDPNNLEMILLRQKAGQLFKDSNKVTSNGILGIEMELIFFL